MAINSNIHKMKNVNFKYLYIFALQQACAIYIIKLILLKAFKKSKVTNLCEWRKDSILVPRKCSLGFGSLNLQLNTWQVFLLLLPKARHELSNVGIGDPRHLPCALSPSLSFFPREKDTASDLSPLNSRWSSPIDQNQHTRQNLP